MTGNDLRTYRHKLGLSQTELAKRLGIAMRTLQRWERSQTLPLHLAYAMLSLARESTTERETTK